jgi:hypothetical protein
MSGLSVVRKLWVAFCRGFENILWGDDSVYSSSTLALNLLFSATTPSWIMILALRSNFLCIKTQTALY